MQAVAIHKFLQTLLAGSRAANSHTHILTMLSVFAYTMDGQQCSQRWQQAAPSDGVPNARQKLCEDERFAQDNASNVCAQIYTHSPVYMGVHIESQVVETHLTESRTVKNVCAHTRVSINLAPKLKRWLEVHEVKANSRVDARWQRCGVF